MGLGGLWYLSAANPPQKPFPMTLRSTSARGARHPWRALWFLLSAGRLEPLPRSEDLETQWSHWVSEWQGLAVALTAQDGVDIVEWLSGSYSHQQRDWQRGRRGLVALGP